MLCSIHRARFICVTNDGSKSAGCHGKITRMRRTSSRRSIRLYPSENGRCSQIIENSKIGVSRHLDSSTTTQMAKIMVQYGRPSRSSWTKSAQSSSGRTTMGKAFRESSVEVSIVGVLACKRRKGPFLSVYVDDIKLAGKKTKL